MFLANAPTQPLIRTVALPRERKLLKKIAYHGAIVGLFLFIVLYVLYTLLGSNFHVVIPGCAYRSAQLSPETLESIISSYKIRTVLNLKGCSDPMAWYLDEAKVAAKLNVSLEDLGMSAGRLPSVAAVRDLVPILERSEYPILIHCNRGIDRTGLVSTMLLLLRTDTSLAQARQQLSLLHGHLALSHTGNMDRFYDLYEQWLTRKGQSHSRNNFRLWLLYDYCPGECSCAFEVVNLRGAPALLPKDHAFALRVKCHNTSVGTGIFGRAATPAFTLPTPFSMTKTSKYTDPRLVYFKQPCIRDRASSSTWHCPDCPQAGTRYAPTFTMNSTPHSIRLARSR